MSMKKTLRHRLFLFSALLLLGSPFAGAGEKITLEAESGAVWFTRNDTRIPGDTGTTFNMMDLTGSGPNAFIRLYATYAFNDRHSLRLTLAPLSVEGTGTLPEAVMFENSRFEAGQPTQGSYTFNTYRLTYRYLFDREGSWTWGAGAALLVRDAEIQLEQGSLRETNDNLGLVPLLHVYGAYQLSERTSLLLDVEGAAAPQGRAIDAALKLNYTWPSGWHTSAGYRTLEGGADNDSVYTFAWLHYALLSVGYTF